MSILLYPNIAEKHTSHQCQNCQKVWPTAQLKPIADFFQRVSAGEPCPSGECPECGALCQPVSRIEDRSEAVKLLAELVEWDAQMGWYETPLWGRARRLLNRIRKEEGV